MTKSSIAADPAKASTPTQASGAAVSYRELSRSEIPLPTDEFYIELESGPKLAIDAAINPATNDTTLSWCVMHPGRADGRTLGELEAEARAAGWNSPFVALHVRRPVNTPAFRELGRDDRVQPGDDFVFELVGVQGPALDDAVQLSPEDTCSPEGWNHCATIWRRVPDALSFNNNTIRAIEPMISMKAGIVGVELARIRVRRRASASRSSPDGITVVTDLADTDVLAAGDKITVSVSGHSKELNLFEGQGDTIGHTIAELKAFIKDEPIARALALAGPLTVTVVRPAAKPVAKAAKAKKPATKARKPARKASARS